MADNEVSIYNMALNAVGTRDNIAATTEESREAEVCRLWFGPVRDHVLRAAPWPSTRAYQRLALLAERDDTLAWAEGDPEPGFRYAYAAPTDMVYPRNLNTFGRFVLGVHEDQRAIFTQDELALLAYTKQQTNIALWDVQLKMAIVHALAAFIAMPLHGKAGRARQAQDTANSLILEARVNAANTDENVYETIPDWIAARGYAGSAPNTRFIYPYGPMINALEASAVA